MSELTIGSLAKQSGVGVETVRFYERLGLIKQPERHSGFRKYPHDDSARIRFVKRAQDLGFTLKEVKEILDLNINPTATCSDIRKRAEQKLGEIDAKIADLLKMKTSIEKFAKSCSGSKKALSKCRILDCFDQGWKC